ncbi:cysteine dioxygenase [Polaribacter sp. IC073]|uniref:cysteine dioxygenase n=1 Tax=Polaribacter sp. IC073 TaxID=2508540 RepID=UPI001CB9828A|nr:cysteine dioxygenase family protein [Polaribacter sp. IC073]
MNSNEKKTTTPQTLNDLIVALNEGERTTYNHIIHTTKLEATAFKTYASWSNNCYTRNCIVDSEKFELILICWREGDQTAIHDHGGEECWVKAIEGEFKETIYKKDETGELKAVKTTISKPNDITYMKDFMGFHRLENMSKKRSMSLHLYAKPIRNCNVFNEDLKTFENKNLDYDTTA